jgi:Reverse transcriptase (RNA-dependent DNA polymerase)
MLIQPIKSQFFRKSLVVTKDDFRSAAARAALNIVRHGDTDIFPLPFESHSFFDKFDQFVDLIVDYDNDFDNRIINFPPTNVNSLVPVSYYGFRWGTQLDPIWNAHFLSCVLAIADQIEEARIPKEQKCVFSYRYLPNDQTGDLFDREFGWRLFMEKSAELSSDFEFVVACDISEFYPRLGHHRIENALKQVAGGTPYPGRIMSFLSNFSNTRSFGLPIGGPGARILSEITLNQIDRLLVNNGNVFTRFADDFHLFAKSREDAYRATIFLSEKLFDNQGLSLQKSKTRIMTTAEFRATNPLRQREEQEELDKDGEEAAAAHKSTSKLLRFSLRFDPYSPTAETDYEELRDQIRQFDIISLLKQELTKSRVHIALSRKLISAIRYLEGRTRDDAVLSIINNSDVLYPIFSSALVMIDKLFPELERTTQKSVIQHLSNLIKDESHVLRVDVVLCFAIRVLQHENTAETQILLQQLYQSRTSALVRRDIILVMANWNEWYWLSDLKNRFRELSAPEKRAFIVSSYSLKDEGKHWRDHIKKELNPFERFVLEWATERVGRGKRNFAL